MMEIHMLEVVRVADMLEGIRVADMVEVRRCGIAGGRFDCKVEGLHGFLRRGCRLEGLHGFLCLMGSCWSNHLKASTRSSGCWLRWFERRSRRLARRA